MKTVCKKLFCLMLVALMLVSAVPFAFAAEGDANNLFIQIYLDGEPCTDTGSKSVPVVVGETYSEAEVIAFAEELYPHYFTGNVTASVEGEVKIPDDIYGAVVSLTTVEEPEEEPEEPADEPKEPIDYITFYFLDKNGNETSHTVPVYEKGEHVTPPAVPVNPVSGFSYWAENENGGGMTLKTDESLVYSNLAPTEFYAIYNKKSAMSELKIYVVRYVNGVRKEANFLFSDYFTTSNDNQMYQYLWDNADDIRTAAIDELGAGYTWNEKFYNYFTDEELTDANMKDNGNKSVYIRMNTKNSNEAQVLLYVHKGKTSTVHDILEMDGYNAGEKVYLNNVKDFLKDEGYKWSSISSLYTDEEYDDLMDGESPSGSNHISITNNGTHVIHVILNGASQSNNADSSNPKTGDSIMVAVTTMTLAAAALVAVVELKKRKMI